VQEGVRRRMKPVIIIILYFMFSAFYGLLPAEITQVPIKTANNVPVDFFSNKRYDLKDKHI
jgi:hypothetical protein